MQTPPAKLLSIVLPCYNEEEVLPLFYEEMRRVMGQLEERVACELIFIDDGSRDGTLLRLRELANADPRARYLSFSRNFGKEAAMLAGLEAARGDYVAVMDVDLQDPPDALPSMLAGVMDEGYDCVAARRVTRKGEPVIRSFFARRYYRLISRLSRIEVADGARDFRLMTRQMTDAVLQVREYNRFSKGIFHWVGFRTKWLEYENVRRAAGETKWSFWKLFLYSLDSIVAFTAAPLALSSVMGFLFCLVALIMILVVIVKTLIWGDPVDGWPSLACIIIFVSGVQLFCIGILGQYLSKTYMETKRRPLYLVREQSDKENGRPGAVGH
jgi:glycosyltransferases involved in cell wall biogenesis